MENANPPPTNNRHVLPAAQEVEDKGKEEDEMETDVEVEEVIEEKESEFETDEEIEEVFEEEEEDEDDENFNSFPTMKELSHHEWLLKKPQPPRQYNQIMTYELRSRRKMPNPGKIRNFVGRVRRLKVFIGSFTYEYDFMIMEDTTRIIDRHLGEIIFGRPFIDETGLVYNEGEGTVMFEQDDEKITFKNPQTIEIFKQTKLIGLSTDSIPPSTHEENFGHGRTHYYQSLLIRDEYKQDRGDRRGIRHLMRLEREKIDNKGEVTLSLLANNAQLKAQIQEKVFAIAALKNDLRKLKGNSVRYLKFAKTFSLGETGVTITRNQIS
ncbi:hypothetical protein Tco_1212781 [Tanacetum coccineum]